MADIKGFEIRDLRSDDFDSVITLLQQLWPDRKLDHAALRTCLQQSLELKGHIVRVACKNNLVVGLCSISIRLNLKAEGNLANIDELVVDGKLRSQQIGKLLLHDAEQIAKNQQCQFIGLESSFHREAAHRFYDQNDYQKQGFYITKSLV